MRKGRGRGRGNGAGLFADAKNSGFVNLSLNNSSDSSLSVPLLSSSQSSYSFASSTSAYSSSSSSSQSTSVVIDRIEEEEEIKEEKFRRHPNPPSSNSSSISSGFPLASMVVDDEEDEKPSRYYSSSSSSSSSSVTEDDFIRLPEAKIVNFRIGDDEYELDGFIALQDDKFTLLEQKVAELEAPKVAAKALADQKQQAEQIEDQKAAVGSFGTKAKRKTVLFCRAATGQTWDFFKEGWLLIGAVMVAVAVWYFFREAKEAAKFSAPAFNPGNSTDDSISLLGQASQNTNNRVENFWPQINLERLGVGLSFVLLMSHILNRILTRRERAEHKQTREAGEDNTLVIQHLVAHTRTSHNALLSANAEIKYLRGQVTASDQRFEQIENTLRSLTGGPGLLPQASVGTQGGQGRIGYNPLATGFRTGISSSAMYRIHGGRGRGAGRGDPTQSQAPVRVMPPSFGRGRGDNIV